MYGARTALRLRGQANECFKVMAGMKILLVSSYILPHCGGVEVLVDQEARILASQGHEVAVIGSRLGEGMVPAYSDLVAVERVAAWNGLEWRFQIPWPVFSPSIVATIWRRLRWCDVVHVHGFLTISSIVALCLARLHGKPATLTEHIGDAYFASSFKRMIQWIGIATVGRLCVLLATQCFGYHDRVVRLLKSLCWSKEKVGYLANPLRRDVFKPATKDEKAAARASLGWDVNRPKVVFVGRLVNRKGIDLLLAARDPSYDMVFCGPGDPSVLGKATSDGHSYFPAKPRGELATIYQAADLLAVPSRSEGGLVLVGQEALVCGTPVLLGNDPDLMKRYHQCRGLFFSSFDAEAIRLKIMEILASIRGETEIDWGERPFESFLPDEDDWASALFPGNHSPSSSTCYVSRSSVIGRAR